MNITELFELSLAAALANNIVLSRFLGVCPMVGAAKKLPGATGMGLAVTFIMSIAAIITWSLNVLVLVPAGLAYFRLLVFVLVIAALVQAAEIAVLYFSPKLYRNLGVYLPMITTNCAILGLALLNADTNPITGAPFTLVEAFVNGLASGAGFLLVLVLMAGIREKLETADVPKALAGTPITLISAGLMAMAFLAFSGMGASW